MKRNKIFEFNGKILLLAKSLLLIASVLSFCLLIIVQVKQQVTFFELLNTSITFNIFYIISMFDAICFFELLYFTKKINENKKVENSLINILFLGIVQLFLLNLFVALALIYFVYNTLKRNGLSFDRLMQKMKMKNDNKVIMFNIVFFILFIILVYSMVLHRFN